MTHSEKWRARDRKRKRERERKRVRMCVYCRVGAKTVDGDQ